MTLFHAIRTWNKLRSHTGYTELQDFSRHQLVHEIMRTVRQAVERHQIDFDTFERLTSGH